MRRDSESSGESGDEGRRQAVLPSDSSEDSGGEEDAWSSDARLAAEAVARKEYSSSSDDDGEDDMGGSPRTADGRWRSAAQSAIPKILKISENVDYFTL